MSEPPIPIGVGVKSISFLLIGGGIAGVAFGFWSELQSLTTVPAYLSALIGLFVVLFGWCAWIGFELWHGKPHAFRWAKIIFAGQILNFTVPGFSFDGFFTGLRVFVMLTDLPPPIRFGFNIASSIHFQYSPNLQNWLFGINFVPIVALVALTQATRRYPKTALD
ncbi:MAG: hypothetical protein WA738_20040 [Candidatus Angelobacter sp.]